MSLRARQLIIAILTSFLPLAVLGLISVYYAKSALEQEIVTTMTVTSGNIRADIDGKITDRLNLLKSLAELDEIKSMDSAKMAPVMKPFATSFPDMDGIVVIDLGGQQIGRSNKGAMVNVKDRDYFRAVVNDRQASFIGAPAISKVTNRPIIGIAVPVTKNNVIVGLVTGYLQIDTTLASSVSRASQDGQADSKRILVVDKNHIPLYHPDPAVSASGKPLELPALQERGHVRYDANGEHYVASVIQSDLSQWIVFSDVSEEEVFAPVKSLQTVLLVLTALLIAVSLVLIRIFVNKITKPLALLGEYAGSIAEGNFQVEINTAGSFDREVQVLADAFQHMKNSVKTMIGTIRHTADQVAASSQEMNAGAEQSAMAAGQIAASVTEVARGTDRQEAIVKAAAGVAGQMSEHIRQVLTNAEMVSGQSAKAAATAQEGGESIAGAVRKMADIEQSVQSSAQVVTKLGQRSQEIGQIVETIAGIAGQTNLLALNAAIEAARAGEQGRGFAVVAEEVRQLAEQSQAAASQIAGLIGEIQAETGNAVAAMAAGSKEVNAGTKVVNAAGEAFQEIVGLVSRLAEQVAGIAGAIGRLDAGSEQLVASVREIDQLTKTTAAESQTVSAATQQQSAAMEQIAASSQNLATLSQNLLNAVDKFRV
ncbi:MAG: methyl-accepting chemotaxis protein [Sporomusaceae bacterium]|nr:methyl-accepting chemotaxis protein [Sporomusaceae bacterium]